MNSMRKAGEERGEWERRVRNEMMKSGKKPLEPIVLEYSKEDVEAGSKMVSVKKSCLVACIRWHPHPSPDPRSQTCCFFWIQAGRRKGSYRVLQTKESMSKARIRGYRPGSIEKRSELGTVLSERTYQL